MKVTLINYALPLEKYSDKVTYDYEQAAGIAAALCVGKFGWGTDDYTQNMNAAIKSEHYSILEHLPLTFVIEDVSRALTHQLVRHRIASYSQLSQRYAKVQAHDKSDVYIQHEWYVTPNTIAQLHDNTPDSLLVEYNELMQHIARVYNKFCDAGVPNEDARFVLPNACFTSIVVSMNARAFIEAAEKRICKKAQWEIRELFCQMRDRIRTIYPTIYELTKPPCLTTGCKEAKPCGDPYQ